MRKTYLLSAALVVGLAGSGCGRQQPVAPGAEKPSRRGMAKVAAQQQAQAVVSVTVTQGGAPAAGVEVAFARSISGRRAEYAWKGTTDASGRATVEISGDRISGYYRARATNASGAVVGQWWSIPINAGKENAFSLPIGGQAHLLLPPANSTLALSFSGLQPLANGFHYEGWAIIGGAPVATGKFNVDGKGALVDLRGNPIPNGEFRTGRDLSRATAIVLTLEPKGDVDAIPADTHYLAGDVRDLSARLTVGHPAALGNDFAGATGRYILATPTDDPSANENSGVWFLDLASGSPVQGLRLPTLPAGWKYEGWAVINGVPVTTGRFTNPAAADEAAPFSGPRSGPPFPGEDFVRSAPAGLTFPTNLAGGAAVISIEPSPDDDAGPFTLKPLIGAIPGNATDHRTYSMDNRASGFPAGTAIIR